MFSIQKVEGERRFSTFLLDFVIQILTYILLQDTEKDRTFENPSSFGGNFEIFFFRMWLQGCWIILESRNSREILTFSTRAISVVQ